jgi:fatty acid desaturase
MAHNHNHCPTFANKRMNRVFGNILSLFYGFPTYAWVPTHNLNHHKYVNRNGDATITWRYSNRHNALVAATYFFVSSYFQTELTKKYLKKARLQNPRLFRQIMMQYAVWGGWYSAWLGLALALYGLKGIWVWTLASAIPAIFSLWTIHLFNYEQHVHTDPWSEHNHSRNWETRTVNFFLFNNGYHGAHHENPGLHWSRLAGAHRELRAHIDPRLIERNGMWWYFIRQYLLAPLFPRLGSVQVGRAPFDPPDGKPFQLASADVELGDAGSNAAAVR